MFLENLSTTQTKATKKRRVSPALLGDKAQRMVLHRLWQIEFTMIRSRLQVKSVVRKEVKQGAFPLLCVDDRYFICKGVRFNAYFRPFGPSTWSFAFSLCRHYNPQRYQTVS